MATPSHCVTSSLVSSRRQAFFPNVLMYVVTQASLRSAFGAHPTNFCHRALSEKTSFAAARLPDSYAVTAVSVTDIWAAPTETNPATELSVVDGI
ncbi:MAG: hypothetical protein ABI560_11585 [Myxococcales bacterium]